MHPRTGSSLRHRPIGRQYHGILESIDLCTIYIVYESRRRPKSVVDAMVDLHTLEACSRIGRILDRKFRNGKLRCVVHRLNGIRSTLKANTSFSGYESHRDRILRELDTVIARLEGDIEANCEVKR